MKPIRTVVSRMADAMRSHPKLSRMLLAGLLLRLLIMPFFAHVDFLSEYARIFASLRQGNPFLFPSRPILTLIELLFLKLTLSLLPEHGEILLLRNAMQSTAGLSDYFLFVSDPGIYRTLFLLKIPYLLFDMGTALVLFRMLSGSRYQWTALRLWWFNPVTIYAFYIFGRYESIALFFIALTLAALQKEKRILAAVAFGLAMNCREIVFMYAPLFILSLWSGSLSKKDIRSLIVPLGIVIGFIGLSVGIRHFFGSHSPLSEAGRSEADFGFALFGMQHGWLLPFFLWYGMVGIWLLETRQRNPMIRFGVSVNAALIGFFLFVTHSAHYPSWMMVFPAALVAAGCRPVRAIVLFSAAWFLYWMFHTDAGVFTLFLASPLTSNFFGWETLPQLYAEWIGDARLLSLGRVQLIVHNIYASCLLYWAWKILRTDTYEPVS